MLILFIIRLKFSKNRNHLARLLAHYFKRIIRFRKSLITNETRLQKREVIHQFWRSIWLIILSGCEIIRVIRRCQAMVVWNSRVHRHRRVCPTIRERSGRARAENTRRESAWTLISSGAVDTTRSTSLFPVGTASGRLLGACGISRSGTLDDRDRSRKSRREETLREMPRT